MVVRCIVLKLLIYWTLTSTKSTRLFSFSFLPHTILTGFTASAFHTVIQNVQIVYSECQCECECVQWFVFCFAVQTSPSLPTLYFNNCDQIMCKCLIRTAEILNVRMKENDKGRKMVKYRQRRTQSRP